MATYTGPAWLVLPNGSEVEVRAALHSRGERDRARWGGTVTVADPSQSIFNEIGATCMLRLLDDATGTVVIRSVGSTVRSAEIADIGGSGPAPF
jgi:hypothetical protein